MCASITARVAQFVAFPAAAGVFVEFLTLDQKLACFVLVAFDEATQGVAHLGQLLGIFPEHMFKEDGKSSSLTCTRPQQQGVRAQNRERVTPAAIGRDDLLTGEGTAQFGDGAEDGRGQ